MASPPGPLTPPAEPSSNPQTATAPPSQPTQPNSAQHLQAQLSQPLTSITDDGTSNRPRDHRLIHLLLASHGIAAYQERVPLQLMDFAYRYTSSILSDALHIQNEGYDQPAETGKSGGRKNASKGEEGDLSLQNLRIAIASRMSYQFQGGLPKDFLKGLAEERNRIGLGLGLKDAERAGLTIGGIRLPHEKYCLTGVGWGLKDEWDSEGEESLEVNGGGPDHDGDSMMQLDGPGDIEGMGEDEDEEGIGNMEDVFGPAGGGGDNEEDQEMEDS